MSQATSATDSFTEYAVSLRGHVNEHLERFTDFDERCPPVLSDAIVYSLTTPGKRLRPILVLLSAEACGSTIDAAMPAACAIEMVHTYSLIHDDLPSMDDDDLRRGQPTCHKKFGEATAILAGDALLTLAFEVLGRHVQPAEVAANCCVTLAGAAGAQGMVGGQADDLAFEGISAVDPDESESLQSLESIHRRKTGAMFVASVTLGGLVAHADAKRLDALRLYGTNLGLAFQIVDDLLDVSGQESATGKRVGKDSNRGKLTYPALLGTTTSRQRAAESIDAACAALAPLAPRTEHLEALANFVLSRDR